MLILDIGITVVKHPNFKIMINVNLLNYLLKSPYSLLPAPTVVNCINIP